MYSLLVLFFKTARSIINMADTWVAVFVLLGAILLAIGLVGAYMMNLMDMPVYFPVMLFVAFIGVILALAGFALGMGGSGEKE